MSDDVETTPVEAVEAVEPEASAAPQAPARKRRRVVLTVLPFVLVLAAVGGAAAYTVQTANGADRTVTTVVWDGSGPKPGLDPAAKADRGRTDTELSRLLMPVPEGYRLGPDIGELGNDGETSGAEATAALKETGRGLAGKQRRELDAFFDKLRVKGVAHRSYTGGSDDLVLSVRVVKMEDERAVRTMHERQIALLNSFGVLRKGPKIEGHKDATCYRMPKDGKDPLDSIACSAYEGGMSVTVEAEGPKPFSASTVAGLVKEQLDHITSPGESI
ncbi:MULTISPECIES: hypothetical protein [unclassified Streptomyces]|uniref:hypothetical protein n=1 Tax=unclassified Streptomyces TaxID=2593676 RepID=UPI001BEAD2C6|nr:MULTISPECIES: hypothetical protein [unclassified Streptomyces]MBT2427819.1 hypothetical protein [Streptomyces sp. ISL-112]MBT2464670.1 hypothetical protein [Streptomyces sp. ISL-63]